MKVKLITSPTTYEAAINTIRQIDVTKMEEYNLLVVPDAFSMQAESLLFDVLNVKSVFNVEVVGISKLASYFLDKGSFIFERVSALEEVFNIFRAVKACEAEFEYFGKCDVDFCMKTLQIIKQFKGCKIRPERIVGIGDNVLDRKMHDIKIVYQKYEEMLGDKLDLSKMLDFCQQNAGANQDFSKINLFFANFDSFSLEINDFICKIAKVVGKVYIGMSKASSLNNSYIFEDDIFRKTKTLAKENSINIEVESYASNLDERRKRLAENLFGFEIEKGEKSDYFLNVLAKNSQEEVDFVAKYIKNAVISGDKFKNFAVAVADQSYYEKIKSTFAKFGIAFYCDDSLKLSQTIICRFLLKCLEFAKLGLCKERLEYLVNFPLFDVKDREEILKQINYFNVDTKDEFLERFEQFRTIVSKIELLSDCKSFKQSVLVVFELLSLCEIGYQNFLEQLEEKELFKEQSQNAQAFSLVGQVLEKLSDLAGEEEISLIDFESLLKLSLESVKVETIPSYIDAVYVADATKSYFEDVSTLFVLGATAGALPQTKNDTAIIDDSDIEKLRLEFLLEPQIKVLNRRSRLKLFECLLHAKDKLVVSSPLVSDGKLSSVSDFVKDLRKLFGENILRVEALEDVKVAGLNENQIADNLKFYIGTKNNLSSAYSLLKTKEKLPAKFDAVISSVCKDKIFKGSKQENLGDENKEILLRKNRVSASALETYFSCPFKHFVSYGLRVRPSENIEPDRRKFGSFQHALLFRFVSTNDEIGKMSKEQVEQFLQDNVLSVAKEFYDEKILKRKHFLSYLKNESKIILQNVVYEQKFSSYRPIYLEERICDNITSEEKLVGFVDRVDRSNQFFRIVDYKTGKTQALKKDLFYGKKLQLFLYGDVIKKRLGLECGGLYYFDCQTKYGKDKKSNRLNGLTLQDDSAVFATDFRLSDVDFKSDIAGFAVKKSAKEGEFSFKGTGLAEDLDKFFSYARAVSKVAISELKDGYILDKPVANECKNCPYLSVCGHRKEDGYRILQTVQDENLRGFDCDN